MGKRKLESDDDDEWAVSLPKASGSIKKGGPSRTGTNATHVKKEPRDHDLNYLATSSVAGSSSSLSSGHVSKNRVKKEALDEDNVGLPGPSSASAPQASTLDAPVKTEDPIPAVPHRSQKRKKKAADSEAPVEKRLARVRTSCPKNIQDRLERVQSQRFFLVDRSRNGTDLQEEFKVLGSTGNVYTIVIKQIPTCDCPDALKGNHCKHLLFVMLKVLGVPANSFSIYQKALLTSELEEIFANAPQAPTASVQHTGLKKAWAKATGSPVKDEDSGGKKRAPEEGDTCPICFEEFEGDKAAIVYCETSCGGPVHNICIAQWHATKPEATCIYCRAPWPKAGAGNGEASRDGQYLNLASAVGISNRRDTTSYYHGPRRGMTQAEAYYVAAARYNGGRQPHADDNDYWWE